MFEFGNIYFTFQILLAEFIFTHHFQRRKGFIYLMPIGFIACIGLSYLFPMPIEIKYNQFYSLLRFLTLFALTIGYMKLIFDEKIICIFSACASGYATQHILFHTASLFSWTPLFEGFSTSFMSRQSLLEITILPILYIALYFIFGRYASKHNVFKNIDVRFNLVAIVTIFVCIGYSRLVAYLGERRVISVSMYAITTCLLALYLQIILNKLVTTKRENETMELLLSESKKQYEISKENMELLNIKYHDLKHRISEFNDRLSEEEIQSVKNVLRSYGHVAHTGSEALDVIMMQNKHRCEELGIELTYLGDASCLANISTPDVYSLFDNALSNAIEAVSKVQEKEKRVIDMTLNRKGDIVTFDITNYYDGELNVVDGLPKTTKADEAGFHGYGIASIKRIVEKYNGNIDISYKNNIFHLHLYLLLN